MTVISALPTAPSRDDPTNFNTRAEAFNVALSTFRTEANAQAAENNAAADAATAGAATATTKAAEAAVSAASAIAVANVVPWVSGTSYTAGQTVWSAITLQTYRRKTNGAGAIDPSTDSANWTPVAALPTGGTTGQALVKTSGADYATQWATPTPEGLVLLATVTPGAVNTIDVTDLQTSKRITLISAGVTIGVADVVAMKLSVDNGATFPGTAVSTSSSSATPSCYVQTLNASINATKRTLTINGGTASVATETNSTVNAGIVNAIRIYTNNGNNFTGGSIYIWGEL